MSRRTRRSFSPEFKADAVKLVKAGGKTLPQVAKDLDLTETALREWVRRADDAALAGSERRVPEGERAELIRLRRENQQLKMERDFLKNYRARRHLLLDEKLLGATFHPPERSGRQLFGAVEPVKKHGPGVAADLRVVTPQGDPV